MRGMDLIFIPVLVRRLLGHPGMSRPMTSSSWTHSYSKQSYWKVNITHLRLPTRPPPPPYMCNP